MKLNSTTQEMLGSTYWTPPAHHYYEKQWRTQRGAWGDPEAAETHLSTDVDAVIATFRSSGTVAGLKEASKRGVLAGAHAYLKARAWTEEELSSALARLRAATHKRPTLDGKLQESFLQARLDETHTAIQKGQTPPQAVIDKPEVPRRFIPRWVSYTVLALGAFSLLLGVSNTVASRKEPR